VVVYPLVGLTVKVAVGGALQVPMWKGAENGEVLLLPVSYTHLTLPTSDLV